MARLPPTGRSIDAVRSQSRIWARNSRQSASRRPPRTITIVIARAPTSLPSTQISREIVTPTRASYTISNITIRRKKIPG
jgi:hypothetical protein